MNPGMVDCPANKALKKGLLLFTSILLPQVELMFTVRLEYQGWFTHCY